jgi:branched-subunit amino acid transport protein AzlD
MTLTPIQTIIIIGAVTLGTVITRFLPFLVFRRASTGESRPGRSYIRYLGDVLPYAAVGLLVVYCLKGVRFSSISDGLPEAIAIICIVALHLWKNNALLSIGAGTAIYMLLVQVVFS